MGRYAGRPRYIHDARLAIDNGAAERAIRPIAVGRANWLQVGGDGGVPTASVLLSVCASARQNRLDPWAYLTHVLSELTIRAAGADLDDLLPDQWSLAHGRTKDRRTE
jgi:transposase